MTCPMCSKRFVSNNDETFINRARASIHKKIDESRASEARGLCDLKAVFIIRRSV
jgi:hypothetical protein